MAVLDAVADRLLAAGVATPGTNLFLGHLPSGPDTCTALFLRGGAAPVRGMGPAGTPAELDLVTVQAMIRGGTIPQVEALQTGIIAALDHWWGTISGVVIQYSELSYAPADLGMDENRRPMRSVVLKLMVRR